MPAAQITTLRYKLPPNAEIIALRYKLPPSAQITTLKYSTPEAPPPPTPEYAQLQGTVQGILGPVANVTVCINGNCTATNPDGSYTITNIPLGTYILTATPPFPYNIIYTQTYQTVDIQEAKTYTLNIYLPINKINVGIIGSVIFLSALAAVIR